MAYCDNYSITRKIYKKCRFFNRDNNKKWHQLCFFRSQQKRYRKNMKKWFKKKRGKRKEERIILPWGQNRQETQEFRIAWMRLSRSCLIQYSLFSLKREFRGVIVDERLHSLYSIFHSFIVKQIYKSENLNWGYSCLLLFWGKLNLFKKKKIKCRPSGSHENYFWKWITII